MLRYVEMLLSFVRGFTFLILCFSPRLFLHDDVHEGLSDVRRKAVEDMKKLREKSGTLKGFLCDIYPFMTCCYHRVLHRMIATFVVVSVGKQPHQIDHNFMA